MINPKTDPSRRCMPFAEWPEQDRSAFEAATRSGDLLDEAGPAAHWRPATRSKVMSSYGRCLTHLVRQGRLDRSAGPSERLDPDILKAYIAELRAQVSPVTLAQRITDLHEALRVMVPGMDLDFLRRIYRRLAARAEPSRDKRARVVDPRDLLDLGIRLMDDMALTAGIDRAAPCWYRDGLIIALLACRAPRRRNLAAMRIGKHLIRRDGGYMLVFDGTETKNHASIEKTLPWQLTPYIDAYLADHRPALLNGHDSDSLWISQRGRPMGEGAIYDRIRATTASEFGHPINLHLFRDCLATAIALGDAEHVGAIPAVLGHIDPASGERHYNQADTVSAARYYQEGILVLRRDLMGRGRRPKSDRRRD